MRFTKKIIGLLLTVLLITGSFSSLFVEAKNVTPAVPKITVKTVKKGTGVKITVAKTKGADRYEVYIYGEPKVDKNYRSYCIRNGSFQYPNSFEYGITIDKNGKAKRSVTIKDIPEGSYKVEVYSVKQLKDGSVLTSKNCKTKSFTLKKQSARGLTKKYDFSNVKIGDVVEFGVYEQDYDYTNGKEPIEWEVLEKNDDSVLLLSKYLIDSYVYDTTGNDDVTWENCTLRKWLSDEFINNNFNEVEKKMMITTTLKNYSVNEKGEVDIIENDTEDKVFILSAFDIVNSNYGFSEDMYAGDINRRCALAWNKNVKVDWTDSVTKDGELSRWWWLRTPCDYYDGEFEKNINCAYAIDEDGILWGTEVYNDGCFSGHIPGIRPAVYVKLKSN